MSPTAKDPELIVLQFNECINKSDLEGLGQLMTGDHVFIDSENNQVKGKQSCLSAWRDFFNLFPDYKNIFGTISSKDNLITITGCSSCSDKRLNGPAIWTAKIKEGKITEWRVYEDTLNNRQQLDIKNE